MKPHPDEVIYAGLVAGQDHLEPPMLDRMPDFYDDMVDEITRLVDRKSRRVGLTKVQRNDLALLASHIRFNEEPPWRAPIDVLKKIKTT